MIKIPTIAKSQNYVPPAKGDKNNLFVGNRDDFDMDVFCGRESKKVKEIRVSKTKVNL